MFFYASVFRFLNGGCGVAFPYIKSDTHNKTAKNNRLPGVKAEQTVAVF